MTEQRERPVANPDRTQVDEDEVTQSESTQHQTKQRDPHDQPWPKVAAEVRRAVGEADGPLER
jgi:hypothetical protein